MNENFNPKILSCLKEYNKQKLIKDLTAGLIVAIIALPLSIALALASGVSPEQGLYTAIIAGFVIALLGGSKVQISGPTAAFATIVAGIVATNGMSGLIIATLIAGVILIIMGICKFGKLIKFVPLTITTGFTTGIAITLIIGQLKDFFGLTFTHSPIETMEKLSETIKCFGTFNYQALIIGMISLAILIIWPKIKYINKIPPSLIAVIVSAVLVAVFNMNVNTIGSLYEISSALPKITIPQFSFDTVKNVIPDAFTIAILAAIESLLSCVVSDSMIKDKHNSNTELIAQGAGNIASALFGGIPATGAIARTAANIKNGGQSPISGIVHAIVLLLVLVFFMPYAALIPMPTIAAILFVVAYNMSEWREFIHIIKISPKSDVFVLITTCLLTVLFDLVVAIFVGLILTCVLFMSRMADVSEVKELNKKLKIRKDILVCNITGALFFGMTDKLAEIDIDESTEKLVINMSRISALDATAIQKIEELVERCKSLSVELYLCHVNKQPMKALKKAKIYDELGEERFYKNLEIAIDVLCK